MMKRFIIVSGCGLNPLANTRSVPDFIFLILLMIICEGVRRRRVIDTYDDRNDGMTGTKKRV
ncbi:hypothetical protein EHJ10_06575 [Cronobacter dublinensis]|nr:hypothetical protein [Cronobacter dublinensis]